MPDPFHRTTLPVPDRNETPLTPVVSVVIPAYNHAAYILRTLRSVHDQTYRNFEVIVVNDGSPDKTHELLMPLADAGRIRYLRQQNAGQAAARNRGIESARGRYIALLDDDDLWPPEKLADQVALLDSDPETVLVYGRAELVGEDGNLLSAERREAERIRTPPEGPNGDCFAAFARRNYILSPGQTLIRRAALQATDEPPFDTDLWGVDDYDLWLRLAERGPFRFHAGTALFYRVHAANASRNEGRMHQNEMRLYRKHLSRAGQGTVHYGAIRDGGRERYAVLRRYWLASGWKAAQKGKWQDARSRLATFLRFPKPF